MLRGFRRHKFVTKCKSDIKMMKLRLETIKKKRNAVQKYLKNDIADLLRSGRDINAYGRAEGLLVEQNMSTCYQLTEDFLECISNHISAMEKQRECPGECKEAVPSLMYAAARFADLPELRALRNTFTEKYGNSLEPFLNKELMERLKGRPPTKEMRIQIMHDIAHEFSIEWDSKALEQKLYTTPQPDQGHIKYSSPVHSDDDMQKSNKKKDVWLNDRHKGHSSSEDESTTDVSQDAPKYCSSSVASTSGDEAENKVPSRSKFAPPPYYKQRPEKKESILEKEPDHHHNNVSVGKDDAKPRSVRRRNVLKPPPGRDNRDEEERIMDGLLMHYSKKQPPYEKSHMKGNQADDDDDGESARNRSRRSQREGPSARASSLPPEPTSPVEAPRRHERAYSLQPEAHVHPKLPEYDDLAARIAALRGL